MDTTSVYKCVQNEVYRRGHSVRLKVVSKLLHGAAPRDIQIKFTINDGEKIMMFLGSEAAKKWNLGIDLKQKYSANIQFTIPCDVEVGEYNTTIVHVKDILYNGTFLVFFNPWNVEDETYYKNSSEIYEYVLEEKTIIYMGSDLNIGLRIWELNQFNEFSIKAACKLLKRIDTAKRKSLPHLVRELTALVNSNDDNGILVGRWSDDYEDGTHPSSWNNSSDILRKYFLKDRPVRYGQCWVFAAVLCTLMRTLGIPSKVITNFDSFHDGDATLNSEVYLDENLFPIDGMGFDSTWNFHCWTEVYFSRSDLNEDIYNGWQVADATPQERSEGRFTCGPASMHAIKNGYLKVKYDVPFIYSEVSGCIVYLIKNKNDFEVAKVTYNAFGKNISTKAVGDFSRNDVTHEYKYDEETLRDIVRENAVNSTLLTPNPEISKPSIKILKSIKFELIKDNVITVKVSNMGRKNGGKISIRTINKIDIPVGTKNLFEGINVDVPCIFVEVFAKRGGGGFAQKSFKIMVDLPSLKVDNLPFCCKIDEKVQFQLEFKNLYSDEIKNAKFFIECSSLFSRRMKFAEIGVIKPEEVVTAICEFTPTVKGVHTIMVCMSSLKIGGLHFTRNITVME